MFLHNGANGPESKTYVSSSSSGSSTSQTSDNVVWASSPGGGTRVGVCHIQLHLVLYWSICVVTMCSGSSWAVFQLIHPNHSFQRSAITKAITFPYKTTALTGKLLVSILCGFLISIIIVFYILYITVILYSYSSIYCMLCKRSILILYFASWFSSWSFNGNFSFPCPLWSSGSSRWYWYRCCYIHLLCLILQSSSNLQLSYSCRYRI